MNAATVARALPYNLGRALVLLADGQATAAAACLRDEARHFRRSGLGSCWRNTDTFHADVRHALREATPDSPYHRMLTLLSKGCVFAPELVALALDLDPLGAP